MPRKADVDRPVELSLKLPESIRGRLDLHLYSAVESRIPKGAYKTFFTERIRDYFDSVELDLSPYGFPEGFKVRGDKNMIFALEQRLKGK